MNSKSRIIAGFVLGAAFGLHGLPANAKSPARVPLTADRMAQLQQVNSHVNNTILEVSDLEQYGQPDVWTLPTSGKGDCEDFALLKRKLLIKRGWPASALSIAVGTTSQGEAHAVLMVTTAQGEFVLDNLTSSILSSSQTGHVFHSRQYGRGWVSATGERTSMPTADFAVAARSPSGHQAPRRPRG